MKKIILGLGVALLLSSCALNSNSDDELRPSFMRGSRTIGVVPANGLYIDNSIKKPSSAEWTYSFSISSQQNLESFLELSSGTLNLTYKKTELFFWGQFPSEGRLDPQNVGSYANYFNQIKKKSFQFEMEIWDELAGNLQNDKRIDLLGYAFFGRHGNNMSGELYNISYQTSGTYEGVISLTLLDSSGLVSLHGRISHDSQRNNFQWRFSGRMDFENSSSSPTMELGYFNVSACHFFKCS